MNDKDNQTKKEYDKDNENVEREMAEEKNSTKYKEKFQALQKYIPAIRKLLDLSDQENPNEDHPGVKAQKLACRKKLEKIYELIENPTKDPPIVYENLVKLEKILNTMYKKIKVQKNSRQGSPTLESLLSEESLSKKDKPGPSGIEVKNLKTNKASLSSKTDKLLKKEKKNFKRKTEPIDSLFTPDPKVSYVRTETTFFSRTYTESGTARQRFSHPRAEFTRPTRHFTPIEESYRPFSVERYRAPNSGCQRYRPPSYYKERFRPYPNEVSERHRAPHPEVTDRYQTFYHENSQRLRHPYNESSERFRLPYNDSSERYRLPPYHESSERYSLPYNESSERLKTPYYHESSERFRASTESRLSAYFENEAERRPLFTDPEEKYYEKPKSWKKTERLAVTEADEVSRYKMSDKSVASSSGSTLTKSTKERCRTMSEEDSMEHSTRKVKVIESLCSASGLSSSDIKITIQSSSWSCSNILDNDGLKMQKKDLEKLTESTQKLKSNLDQRVKNIQAKQRLLAGSKDVIATTHRNLTIKSSEDPGVSRESEEIIHKKLAKNCDEKNTEPNNKEADAFIDNLMSNLTTKFGLKRELKTAHEQIEIKPDSAIIALNTLVGKEHEMININSHESNLKLINKPFVNTEDTEEVANNNQKEKQMLSEKIKPPNPVPTMDLIGKQTSMPSVFNNDSIKNLAVEIISTGLPMSQIWPNADDSNRSSTLSAEDKAEMIFQVQQIISKKKESMSNTENQADKVVNSNNDSLQVPTPISAGQDRKVLHTTTNLSNVKDNKNNRNNDIVIPGLDGIIPPTLDRNSVSFPKIEPTKTKDQIIVTKTSKDFVNKSSLEKDVKSVSSEEVVQRSNVIGTKVNEDSNKNTPSQSLRSKLTGEISTLHKVGTPCGGALRGLVKRDKMMPPGQVASLKTGALYDLMSEDKPSRSTKTKVRRQLQPNSSTDTNNTINMYSDTIKKPSCSSEAEIGVATTPDDIISKLSTNDLKKIITDNIGALPIPPNLAFLNNPISPCTGSNMKTNSSSSEISWNNQNSSVQQINIQAQNIVVNNIHVQPVDKAMNNYVVNQQTGINWGHTDVNDVWKNKTHIKDPRRDSQLTTHVTAPNHQPFEKPTYSTSYNERDNSMDSFHFNSYNTPVVLQSNPNISPCYDGSSTPDPYRSDPYTLSLKGSYENPNQIPNSSLLGEPNIGREIIQRPPLLRTPPLMAPRSSLLGTPSFSQEREVYSKFSDVQQSRYNDHRNITHARITYGEWKAEKNAAEAKNSTFLLSDASKHNNEKLVEDGRNINKYKWTRETALTSYDHQGGHYNDVPSRTQPKESETVKKLSARDPRRKSIEDSSERKDSSIVASSFSKIENSNQDWCSKKSDEFSHIEQSGNIQNSTATSEKLYERTTLRDPRSRARTIQRGRSTIRDCVNPYSSKYSSLSKGRTEERSLPWQKNTDTYSSPLNHLYSNDSDPKTGLGYGLQNFKIPIRKNYDRRTKPSTRDNNSRIDSTEKYGKELEFQKGYNENSKAIIESNEDTVNTKENDHKKGIDLQAASCDESCGSKDIQNCRLPVVEELPEVTESTDDKESNEEQKTDNISDCNEIDSSSKDSSCEEESKYLPCRRSKRLMTKKRKKQAKSNSHKEVAVINQETIFDTKQQCNFEGKTDDGFNIHSSDQSKELKSSNNNEKMHKSALKSPSSVDNEQVSPDDVNKSRSLERKSYVESLSENLEIHSSKLKTKEDKYDHNLSKSDSKDKKEDLTKANILIDRSDELSNILKPSKEEPAADKYVTHAIDSSDNVVKVQSSPKVEKVAQNSGESNLTITSVGNNVDMFQSVPVQIHEEKPKFQKDQTIGSVEQSSILKTNKEIKEETSVLKEPTNNPCVNIGPQNKINVERLQEVIGRKLTPDAISKIAEILSVEELKTSTLKKEKPLPCALDEDIKSIGGLPVDTKSEENNDISGSSSKPPKEELNNENFVVDNTTVSDSDDGQGEIKSTKGKLLKKKKRSKSLARIPKKNTESVNSKPKRKYKNELDRLQDDISKYHDSEAIAAASGPRQCRLQKEKNQFTEKTQVKPNQSVKKKHRKCDEDNLDDSEASIKDGSSKCQEDELDELDEVSVTEESDDEMREEINTKEEPNENKYSHTDSSDEDPIHLYSEKIRSKYDFVFKEEAKGEQSSSEISTRKSSKENEANTINSTLATKMSDCEKSVLIKNDGLLENNLNEKAIITLEKFGTKSESVLVKDSDDINHSAQKCSDSVDEKECNFGDKRNKVLANNILHKYGLKKQRKKSFWSAGIIRKKTKPKKNDSPFLSHNEDSIVKFGLSCIEDEDDIVLSEAPDLNYYQEGDSKATKCKLCSFYGKSIVSHYAITHPKDEVLISRMSPHAAEIAIKESNLFFSLNDEKKKNYSSCFDCRICYLKFPKFSTFFEHVALHTGEFRHECCKCGYRTSTRSGIMKHFQSHNVKNTNIKSCRVLYKEPLDKTFFSGFLCSVCNYFQISQKNVKRHVENVHDLQDSSHVVKINFSKINFNESDLVYGASQGRKVPEKSLATMDVKESLKRTVDAGADKENASDEQLLSDTCNILQGNKISDYETPNLSSAVKKPSYEDISINTTRENITESVENSVSCKGGSLSIVSKLSEHNFCMNKSLISQDIESSLQETPLINSPSIEKKYGSSVNVAISKESNVLSEDNYSENKLKNEENNLKDSFNEDAIEPFKKRNAIDPATVIVNNCSETFDTSALKVKTVSTAVKETPIVEMENSVKNSTSELSKKEKEQMATMLIQHDWFLTLSKNIAEINQCYLIENANESVSSRIQNLKLKAGSPDIADEVSQRCVSDEESPLSLNDFLDIPISFKVERKKSILGAKCNESFSQESLTGDEMEDTVPARRHLPERTCKGGLPKQINDKERDGESTCDEEEVEIFQIVNDIGQCENNWDDEVLVKEEVLTEELNNLSGSHESSSQSLSCLQDSVHNYIRKNASRKPLSIQDKLYISSLPPNSNFSEFTHVMKQISQVSLKMSEIKEVKVGGLKVLPHTSGVIFSCSLNLFNKECVFQTPDLEAFGQHVNMSHHTSYWNGVCSSCQVHFVRDPNSHDKFTIYTQSKAFCHLVREHLTFTKKSTKSRGNSATSEDSEEIPPPRLRVRRFSGDKLSGTDAANILPQPMVEVTGVGEVESAHSMIIPQQPEEEASRHTPSPTEAELNRGIKTFIPFNSVKGAKATFKSEISYNKMCCPLKLRHLYKCMGAQCSFTSTLLKDFAKHFDDHKQIYGLNPADDPHRGFWNVCAYCLTPHASSKELCIHIRKEHAVCQMQCSRCFYRAKSIANVHYHHTVEHTNEKFQVLFCPQSELNLPPCIERPFTDFVSELRCVLKESCSLFTYMLHTFCNHLKAAHPDDLRCHLCMEAHPDLRILLKHYCETHGIGLYQCLFCTHGASTEPEIRLHLCYAHPNTDPKAVQRTDLKPHAGSTNKESIKRIMFYKDQDKLMAHVSYPAEQSSPAMESAPTPTPGSSSGQNIRSMLQQAASAISSVNRSRFIPSILRGSKHHSEESPVPTPPKLIRLSPQKSSEEGAKSGGIRIILPSPTDEIPSSLPSTSSNIASSLGTVIAVSTIDPRASISSVSPPSTLVTVDKSSERDTLAVERTSPALTDDSNSAKSLTDKKAVDANYFKCGNKDCSFEASTSAPLRNHLVICDQARQSQKLSCAFCHRVFKQVTSFVEHLRGHGPERYACSMCPFKASLLTRVNAHMKACHQIVHTSLVPVDPSKQDSEKDYFIVSGKEKRREKPGPKGKARGEVKTKFSPEELEDVPKAAIFQNPLGCRLCSYESKVRSNLIRHIQQHASGNPVPQEEVVNPVPEKTEKMFDKMMNLAGSSHKKKHGLEDTKDDTAECIYKYVSDQDRYMCHIKECGYRSLSETMLRDHISVIHKDETFYLCPHCIEDAAPIPIDQLSMHLKLHDSPVFKCAYCDFCSHIKRSIERHSEILHPGEPLGVLTVRHTKPDQNLEQAAPKVYSSDKLDEQGEEWYWCNHCAFKTKKRKIILQHGVLEHKIAKPFKCSSCGYESLTEQILRHHLNTYHSNKDCELIALYKKVTELKKPVLPPIPPLWKRDAKRLKLIRGIKLDEKGDAPPPVATATTGIEGLDVLELKFGHFGKPLGTSFMCPRCSTSFVCKNRQEMKEHLYKDLEYSPVLCKICKIGSTQRTKVMKHINKVHNIEWDRISESLDIITNEELESWVEKVLARQASLMKPDEMSSTWSAEGAESSPRKRRRSSVEATADPLELPHSPPTAGEPPSDCPSSSQESISSDSLDERDGREKRRRDKCPSRHRFSCEYCDTTTKYKHSILLHCRKVHPNLQPRVNTLDRTVADESVEAYNCMYCNCTSLSLNNLKHHWIYTHKSSGLNFLFRNTVFNTDVEYECYWCKKQSDLESLEEHCRDAHSPAQRFLVVSVSVPKYKCSECTVVCKSVDSLKKHFAMVHPSSNFSLIVVSTNRPVTSSNQNSLSSDVLPETSSLHQITYKCFTCSFVSHQFWLVVKHMHDHFVTYVCTECENWFSSALRFSEHMSNKHPSSSSKPHILKGSEADIENAKKNIIVISESGERKITEEELALTEKENKLEEDIDIYSYDEPLDMQLSPPVIKETARKSTGSPKYRLTPPKLSSSPNFQRVQESPSGARKSLFKTKAENININETFVTVISNNNKVIKLPAVEFGKIINIDPKLKLTANAI